MPEKPNRIEVAQRWWSVSEIASALNLADATVRGWCRRGALPSLRVGPKLFRIGDGDLQTFLRRVHRAADRVRAGGEPGEFAEALRESADECQSVASEEVADA